MHPVFLYLPGERLSGAELGAARLDGDVVELGEVYAPCDLVETPALRAASLAPLLRTLPDAAFAGMSAAWIHGAGDAPPERHELQSATGRRLRRMPPTQLLVHDPALEPEDLQRLGGIAVASPERTLIDLLRWPSTLPARRTWALALALVDPGLAARALTRLATIRPGPGFARTARVLEHLCAAQDEVTR